MRSIAAALFTVGSAAALAATLNAAEGDQFWPQWRGPEATGVSRTAKPPAEWSESKNIRWKKEIPGRGASTRFGVRFRVARSLRPPCRTSCKGLYHMRMAERPAASLGNRIGQVCDAEEASWGSRPTEGQGDT